jgi:hypothetical protein
MQISAEANVYDGDSKFSNCGYRVRKDRFMWKIEKNRRE